MKIAIRKEENNSIYIDKEICNNVSFKQIDLSVAPYNYKIIEIDESFKDCINCDFNEDLTFNENKYTERLKIEDANSQIIQLERWFNDFFEPQLIQSLWQQNYIVSKDIYLKDRNGDAITYKNIDELKKTGEEKRALIKSLRKLLKR
jgi:hypothetical protein